jgi:hypothetical protein
MSSGFINALVIFAVSSRFGGRRQYMKPLLYLNHAAVDAGVHAIAVVDN